MGEARDALERRMERFVDEIEALVRRATIGAVEDALQAPAPEGTPSVRPTQSRRGSTSKKRAASKPRRRHELSPARAKLLEQMVEYVSEHPGAKMQEISAALSFPTDFLQPLMKRPLESGALRKEGERNKTRYFPGRPGE